jgi:hypothetical protein
MYARPVFCDGVPSEVVEGFNEPVPSNSDTPRASVDSITADMCSGVSGKKLSELENDEALLLIKCEFASQSPIIASAFVEAGTHAKKGRAVGEDLTKKYDSVKGKIEEANKKYAEYREFYDSSEMKEKKRQEEQTARADQQRKEEIDKLSKVLAAEEERKLLQSKIDGEKRKIYEDYLQHNNGTRYQLEYYDWMVRWNDSIPIAYPGASGITDDSLYYALKDKNNSPYKKTEAAIRSSASAVREELKSGMVREYLMSIGDEKTLAEYRDMVQDISDASVPAEHRPDPGASPAVKISRMKKFSRAVWMHAHARFQENMKAVHATLDERVKAEDKYKARRVRMVELMNKDGLLRRKKESAKATAPETDLLRTDPAFNEFRYVFSGADLTNIALSPELVERYNEILERGMRTLPESVKEPMRRAMDISTNRELMVAISAHLDKSVPEAMDVFKKTRDAIEQNRDEDLPPTIKEYYNSDVRASIKKALLSAARGVDPTARTHVDPETTTMMDRSYRLYQRFGPPSASPHAAVSFLNITIGRDFFIKILNSTIFSFRAPSIFAAPYYYPFPFIDPLTPNISYIPSTLNFTIPQDCDDHLRQIHGKVGVFNGFFQRLGDLFGFAATYIPGMCWTGLCWKASDPRRNEKFNVVRCGVGMLFLLIAILFLIAKILPYIIMCCIREEGLISNYKRDRKMITLTLQARATDRKLAVLQESLGMQ